MSKKSSTFAPAFEKERVFLAQLVEQLTLNQWVQGSSPWEDTKRHPIGCLFFCFAGCPCLPIAASFIAIDIKYLKICDFSCICAFFALSLQIICKIIYIG